MKTTKLSLLLTGMILSFAVVSCSYMEDNAGGPEVSAITSNQIYEVLGLDNTQTQGGNLTCDNLALFFGTSFTGTTERNNFIDGQFESEWPEGLQVTVTEVDGSEYIEFTYNSTQYCVGAVIVKGGPNANVYYYPTGIKSDQALHSPFTASGKPADLSNLTFCFVACESDPCWEAETAFGGDTQGAGNAWWFAFDTQGEARQNIYAGQNLVPGAYVEYDAVNDALIIVLGDKLKLQDPVTVTKTHPKTGVVTTSLNSEQVKVQGYNVLPSSRPSAGLFTTYKGRNLVINGNGSRYYVIHLDAEVAVDCR